MDEELKTAEQIIDYGWKLMFEELCKINDDLYDLKVIYKEQSTGKTIIRSWKDRDDRLSEEYREGGGKR